MDVKACQALVLANIKDDHDRKTASARNVAARPGVAPPEIVEAQRMGEGMLRIMLKAPRAPGDTL